MNVTDTSSILRPIPNRPAQPAAKPNPKPVTASVQSMSQPASPAGTKAAPSFMETASVVLQKPTGHEPEHAKPDRLKALLADWGKTDSPHDLNGDGTVGIQDMLQLLGQMTNGTPDDTTDPNKVALQQLLDDWGKTGSAHDLNGDGTVGIQDMLQLLAEMSNGTPDDATNPDKAALQQLLDDWGKTGSVHDLNGDGTVGIQDMLQLLTSMSETTDEPDDDDTNNQQTRLSRLIADWGKTDSGYDLDGSGRVGIRDMLMLLARMSPHRPEAAQAVRAEPEHHTMPHQARGFAHYARTSAMHLANSLMDDMSGMEPGEIRESIRNSRLPKTQKGFVLDHIAEHRPHGRRISLLG